MRRAWFVLLLACGAGSLLFDLTLSSRLPHESDWAELAGALRSEARAGDAAQLWPAWAEEARLHIDSMPVLAEEDLLHADYLGFKRLWVVSLPHFGDAEPALRERGATPAGPSRRFGALQLQAWDLHAPLIAPLTAQTEEHEVDYVARRCVLVRIGSHFVVRGLAGSALHVRAGVVGERAYDADRPPVAVQVFAEGQRLGTLDVPRTTRDGTGWRRLDVPMPAGAAERQFIFTIDSADTLRPFCLTAWTSK
jgi:hypothetical protein